MPQVIFSGQTGCLLPLLIMLNLLFGRPIFNSVYLWLGVEAGLIIIFIIKIYIFTQRITQQLRAGSHKPHGRVVDVEGKVVEEKDKLIK